MNMIRSTTKTTINKTTLSRMSTFTTESKKIIYIKNHK